MDGELNQLLEGQLTSSVFEPRLLHVVPPSIEYCKPVPSKRCSDSQKILKDIYGFASDEISKHGLCRSESSPLLYEPPVKPPVIQHLFPPPALLMTGFMGVP